jgi:hypothetical protein
LGVLPIIPAEPDTAAAAAPGEDSTTDDSAAEAAEGPADIVPEYPDVAEGTSSVVTLVFPEEVCPERFVFVLHQLGPDAWVRDHGKHLS